MRYNTLLVWMTLFFSCLVAHGQKKSWQQQFIMLDADRKDSAYVQSVSDQLKAQLETGEYKYVCADQSAVEWLFIDQYVKGNPRLKDMLFWYVSFRCPVYANGTDPSYPNNYDAVMSAILNMLREYNQTAKKPVSVLGLDFLPDLENTQEGATWLSFPVNRRIATFNEATLTDSLMALTDKWWDSQPVAANALRMMDARKKELTKAVGYEYYTLWRHFFMRYAEYMSTRRKTSPEARQRRLQEDFSYIDSALPGGKIIIGYDWLIHTLSHIDTAE